MSWKEPLTDEIPESLLQMRRRPNWVDFVLDRPMAQAPGAGFNYGNFLSPPYGDLFAWLAGRKLDAVIHLGAISDTTA